MTENMATSILWMVMINTFMENIAEHHARNMSKLCFYGLLSPKSIR